MAISEVMAKLLRKVIPSFEGFRVCELGDQLINWTDPREYAEGWYRKLGAVDYVSIDGNGKATVTADLNLPLPKKIPGGEGLRPIGEFDLVTDFGTGEHVFDQAQVWRTIHRLTKVDGYIALIRPTQGYVDHGFFNVQPCLVLDVAFANGYEVKKFKHIEMTRGQNIFAIMRRRGSADFCNPQQGRYHKALRPIRRE